MGPQDDPSTIEAPPVLAGQTPPIRPATRTALMLQTAASAPMRRAVAGAAVALAVETVRLLLARRSRRRSSQSAQPPIYVSAVQINVWLQDPRDNQ